MTTILNNNINENAWLVANINGYKVKYCYADRHYYLLSPAGNAWERMSLKTIAFITNAEATFISHEVKHGKVYEPWQEYHDRHHTGMKTPKMWTNILQAVRGTRHSLDMAVSRFSKDAIRKRLAYLISQAWYVGQSIGFKAEQITLQLNEVNPAVSLSL